MPPPRVVGVALVAALVAGLVVAAVLIEIRQRSQMRWCEIVADWRRFGVGRSAACIASNALLRAYAAFHPFHQRAVYRSDAEIEAIAPGAGALRAAWRVVRDESRRAPYRAAREMHGGFEITDDAWDIWVLKRHGCEFTLQAARAMPTTCGLLREMGVDMALLSRLAPGTTLPRHTGPSFCFMRYHLCLEGDGRASIEVDGNTYVWHPGEHVVFDETRPHSAHNPPGAAARVVLFADVPRPGLDWLVRIGTRLTAGAHGWKDD